MPDAGIDAVIWGLTIVGRPFRPSDWADRLAGLTSAFGQERRLAYSPHVQPVSAGGVAAVVVGGALASLEPRLYQFLVNFARDNELRLEYHPAPCDFRALVPPSSSASHLPREPM